MRLRSALPWLLAASCDSETPHPHSTPETGDTGTPTDFDGFVPHGFGITAAEFAIDASGRAGPWVRADGTAAPAWVTLALADDTVGTRGWVEGNHCEVTWSWSVPTAAATTPETTAWRRFDLTATPTAVTDTCAALVLPARWSDDAAGAAAAWTFGFGIGALDPAVRDALEVSFGDDFATLAPYIGGGGFFWDGLAERTDIDVPDEDWRSGWVDTGVVYGYALDADGREVLSGGLPLALPTAETWDGNRLLPARYALQGTTLLTPARILVEE